MHATYSRLLPAGHQHGHPEFTAHVVVYANREHRNLDLLKATVPFPLTVLSFGEEWKGTLDKLMRRA